MKNNLFHNQDHPLIIAHRGASSYAFENTLDSFRKATEFGADMIELDVRMTRDGHLIVFHDSTLDRLTDSSGLVQYFTLQDLKKIKIHGEAIPTLREVIELTKGKTNYNIEIKNIPSRGVKKLIEILDKYDLRYKIIASSFQRKIVSELKKIDNQIKTALLCWYLRESNIKFAKENDIKYIHPFYGFLSKNKIEGVHNQGIKINTWTVNTGLDLRWLMQLGIDGVITNRPDMAKAVLGKLTRQQATINRQTIINKE